MMFNKNKKTHAKRDVNTDSSMNLRSETNDRPVRQYLIMGFQPKDDASMGRKPSEYLKTFPKDFHPIKTVVASKK